MTTQIQRRRGTTTEHASFTGAVGEITIDTTKDTVVVHDGSVAGGHPLAKEKDPVFTGNVGIGTSAPSQSLTLRGEQLIETNSTSADSGNGIYWHSTSNGWAKTNAHAAIYGKRVDGSNGYLRFDTRKTGTTDERMRIDNNGRLLVGLTAARTDFFSGALATNVQVEGSGFAAYSCYATDGNGAFVFARGNPINNSVVGNLSWQADDGTDEVETARIAGQIDGTPGSNDMPGRLVFSTTANDDDSVTERMRIDSSGDVGIGTAGLLKKAIEADLHVVGSSVTSPVTARTSGTPTGNLHVQSTSWGANVGGSISLGSELNNIDSFASYGSIAGRRDSNLGYVYSGYLQFSTSDGSDLNERMRITNSGNVGIGTTAPGQKLHVAGGSRFGPDGSNYWQFDETSGLIRVSSNTTTFAVTTAGVATAKGATLKPDNASGGLYVLDHSDHTKSAVTVLGDGSITTKGAITAEVAGNTNGLVVKQSGVSANYIQLYAAAGGGGQLYINDSSGNIKGQILQDGSITAAGRADLGTTSLDNYAVAAFSSSATNGGVYSQNNNTSGKIFTGQAGNTEVFVVKGDGKVGIGTSAPSQELHVKGGATVALFEGTGGNGFIGVKDSDASKTAFVGCDDGVLKFQTSGSSFSDKMVILENGNVGIGTSSPGAKLQASGSCTFTGGEFLVAKTASSFSTQGFRVSASSDVAAVKDNATVLYLNRLSSDGHIVQFYQDTNLEGAINVSGSDVTLVGSTLSRWSQLAGGAERTEILRGSVLSNLDEMCEWGEEDNEQMNRMKVSDVEGDVNVAGVFRSWDDDDDTYTNDFYCSMTGDFVIRIAQGTTVARGDLLMSAGDGTAKPQDDDIVRSKTIAKVTSTTVSTTHADGSYCVPCVLMAC
jgi:hypothetical protein|tara:strand:- start:2327 stop:4981 length:2655 start_codon:yes stop_codon:yes gene_type:complete